MICLDVLAVGSLIRDSDGSISEAHSTSTLIRADDVNIVVDTSSRQRRADVSTAFRQLKVLPKDVNIVVLTHTHSDHVGNIDMFPKAKLLIHKGEKGDFRGAKFVDEDMEIAKGVKLVHTPGHTKGSMSVFVEADRRYVIAGDAVPLKDNFLKMVPPSLNYDMDLALESLKKIIDYADVVIPGHDRPFMTER